MKEIEGRLHTPKNFGLLPVSNSEFAYNILKIVQEHLKNSPLLAYLHPNPARCDYLFIRPEGPLDNDYIAIVKIKGIIPKEEIDQGTRPPVSDGYFDPIEDVDCEKAFLFSNVVFININSDSVTKLDGSPFKAVNDMSQAKTIIEEEVYQQLTKKLENIPEPLFSNEFNLIENEEKIKAKLEPFPKEDKKNKVDSMFDELSRVSNSSNKKEVTTSSYERDARLSYILKEKYDYTCQVCGTRIELPDGICYIEPHHIIPLSEGGKDCLSNMISVCPNCHIRFQRGAIEWDFKNIVLMDKINNNNLNLKVNFHL